MKELVKSRHRNFYIALALGLVVAGAVALFAPALALVSGINVFFLSYLGLTAAAAKKLSASFLRQHAAEEDAPAALILVVMLVAVSISAVSLFLVLMGEERMPLQLALSVASIILGWFAVHTMWALHYAYEYYQAPKAERGKKGSTKVQAGLDFPGGDDPNGIAFVYFSYVIGMTAQTSDTAVTSNGMRRLVLVHSIFSFFFNTVLVAAAVNIVVSLAH